MKNGDVILSRHCEAVQIPSGSRTMLRKGSKVRVIQSLGGSFTAMTDYGSMVRIAGEDADALGMDRPASVGGETAKDKPLEELVWDQLKTCYDPEIPINIVELGLVYECKLASSPEGDGSTDVDIKMTLTAPGCGMGEAIKRDAEEKIKRLAGVKRANVELVWEPPWDQSKISEAARLKLGLM